MSPKSRGRRTKSGKRVKVRKPAPSRSVQQSPFPRLFGGRPGWYDPAIMRVLDGAASLATSAGPRELEQRAAELIGGELHRALQGDGGLWFHRWFGEVIDAAVERLGDGVAAAWLLHGLAAQDPGLREHLDGISALTAVDAQLPGWVPATGRIAATGRVLRLRDAYGTRFGVLAEYTHPGRPEREWYRFDIDASGFVEVVDAGVHEDVEDAGATWRATVGAPAADAVAVPVEDPADLRCLVQLDTGDELGIRGDEPRVVLDNWFRVHARIATLGRARPLPTRQTLLHGIDTTALAAPFSTWFAAHHGHAPDAEALETLATEWMEGTLPETWFSVSPKRLRFQRVLIGDWMEDDPITIGVQALLPEWTRWLAERTGLPAALADAVIDSAGTASTRG